jgi:hypothetical protein
LIQVQVTVRRWFRKHPRTRSLRIAHRLPTQSACRGARVGVFALGTRGSTQ